MNVFSGGAVFLWLRQEMVVMKVVVGGFGADEEVWGEGVEVCGGAEIWGVGGEG